ncbi:WhiB family transcriptional regulator [Mycolicibacterium goodii]|uniref:WhiB family transcription factor n=1 Tax=Mycobacterium phage Rem711 TaxID=2079285 RepID=A0A2K9VF12_9CAUD|nr:WhiB family transcriptional regulator [Mycolicibacterium goodii]YP_009964098.1 WhiB family transcriptional regulator [Mycobacterium phage Rem711]AUV60851.1 WhiB family transcription factor [Mycobacterium phage Rem711]MBU8834458.1 WhiB family transcriptional regulator [Mycolicibacterium goodii]
MPVGHYDRTRIPRRGRPGFLRGILGDLDREWMSDARCASLLTLDASPDELRNLGRMVDDMFFPVSGRSHVAKRRYANQIERGKAVCQQCPVRLACEQYRASLQDPHGLWGGRDEFDRDETRSNPARLRSSQEGSSHT